jgi:ribosome maturation factor RimP
LSKGGSIIQAASRIAAPIVQELGLYIWDIQYVKEGATWYLRVIVDKDQEGGIDLKDCESCHRRLSAALDEADPIEGSYWLDVSSPGLERELTKEWHYEKLSGQAVQVNLIRPANGQKLFIGRLKNKDENGIHILIDGETEMTFLPAEAAWVRLYYDFDSVEEETE